MQVQDWCPSSIDVFLVCPPSPPLISLLGQIGCFYFTYLATDYMGVANGLHADCQNYFLRGLAIRSFLPLLPLLITCQCYPSVWTALDLAGWRWFCPMAWIGHWYFRSTTNEFPSCYISDIAQDAMTFMCSQILLQSCMHYRAFGFVSPLFPFFL